MNTENQLEDMPNYNINYIDKTRDKLNNSSSEIDHMSKIDTEHDASEISFE